ncbi:MAG TPA: LytTR family DNA-binding domain-containing protein [Solirubrobacteraceae bacterium]|nr:LytTR family DNA-binding domain-containing protein [Solirubrobacteraceae bacterium]
MTLKLLAVDDELPALEDLVRMLEASPSVEHVESAASAEEALVALGDGDDIDAVFLDVRMPGLDGLELARVLRRFERPPAVVFVSAFDDAAVSAFELAALDYLVKPVSRRRLDEAIERVARQAGRSDPADEETVAVDALRGGGTRLLARSSILYLQAHGDYVRVAADDGRYLLRARLSDLEDRWAAVGFVRVHRGFVVNLRRAVEVRPRLNGTAVLVMTDGAEVPIARRQVGELRRKLGV